MPCDSSMTPTLSSKGNRSRTRPVFPGPSSTGGEGSRSFGCTATEVVEEDVGVVVVDVGGGKGQGRKGKGKGKGGRGKGGGTFLCAAGEMGAAPVS